MSPTLKILWLWGPVVGFMAAVMSVTPSALRPLHENIWDKASHAAAFLVFGFCCLRAFHGGMSSLQRGRLVAAMLLAIGFGAFDEALQSFRPERFGSVGDALADAFGALVSIPVYALSSRWLSRPSDTNFGED